MRGGVDGYPHNRVAADVVVSCKEHQWHAVGVLAPHGHDNASDPHLPVVLAKDLRVKVEELDGRWPPLDGFADVVPEGEAGGEPALDLNLYHPRTSVIGEEFQQQLEGAFGAVCAQRSPLLPQPWPLSVQAPATACLDFDPPPLNSVSCAFPACGPSILNFLSLPHDPISAPRPLFSLAPFFRLAAISFTDTPAFLSFPGAWPPAEAESHEELHRAFLPLFYNPSRAGRKGGGARGKGAHRKQTEVVQQQ